MSVSLDGKLVVAISSRALFDFEEENRVFEQGDDRAYMRLQLNRLEQPASQRPEGITVAKKRRESCRRAARRGVDRETRQPRNRPKPSRRSVRTSVHEAHRWGS